MNIHPTPLPRTGVFSPTRVGVMVALIAIVLGPWYTDPGYSWVTNSVSELAAQNTQNAWIMRVGLFALGTGFLADFLRSRTRVDLPFAVYGLFMILVAVFPHKPFVEGREYSAALDVTHSVFAFLAGFSSVVGFVLRAVIEGNGLKKLTYGFLAAAYTVLPIFMGVFPSVEGLLQRIIFGSFFIWAAVDYPRRG